MPNYRRAHTPGARYFFTVNTFHRQAVLTHSQVITALRRALRTGRNEYPFTIDAMVVLPDHLHAIWTLPPGDADYAKRWSMVKRKVSPVGGVFGWCAWRTLHFD